MDPLLADVVELLTLEQIERNIFRGDSRDIGSPQAFGGQVLGQALWAAGTTVEDRTIHSLLPAETVPRKVSTTIATHSQTRADPSTRPPITSSASEARTGRKAIQCGNCRIAVV